MSVLIFLGTIRRELNFLPDLLVDENTIWLGRHYEWWEDAFLLLLGGLIIGLLIYSWRYFQQILISVPKSYYIAVMVLIILQYLGEHTSVFGHDFGVVVEEVSEGVIYSIAFYYLLRFKLTSFNNQYIAKQK